MESKINQIVALALRIPNAQLNINNSISQVHVFAFPVDENGSIPENSQYLFEFRGNWADWSKETKYSIDMCIKELTEYVRDNNY